MEISCTICLTSMTSSDELLGTLCGHVCHSPCMIDWLKRSQTCPQCRRVVRHRDIGRIYLNFMNSDNSLMESVLNNHQNELDHLKSVLHQKTDIIANYQQRLKNFPGILLQKDQELQEKAASIANYQKQLKDFPGILLQRDQELQEKAASIANYQKQLKDFPGILLQKDRELQEKTASLAICQTQLKGLNKLLEIKDRQVQQKSAFIADHQIELKDLLSLVQQRDQQIKQKDQQMQQNAAIIADQKRELENLLSLVQQRNQQLQEKTAIIGNLENEIKKKDQNNTDQMTVIENLKKQIEADQRYFQPQLALQQARILELEMRNQLTSGQVVAETKRVTSESEKCIKLEECVADLSKKLSDECAKSSNLEQHSSMCDRQKLELQARLDSLEKQLKLKEEKTKNASQSNTKKRTANVSSNVKSEPNLVQPKVEPNASGSKTNKRAARAPLGTINQNSEQSRYNLRPR